MKDLISRNSYKQIKSGKADRTVREYILTFNRSISNGTAVLLQGITVLKEKTKERKKERPCRSKLIG